MYKKGYKYLLKIKQSRSSKQLGLPASIILSFLLLSFRLVPISSTEVCRVYLFAWVSKTWTGRHSASSLPQGTGRVPVASMNRANFLSWSFIDSPCKPRNISLFLASIFLSTTFLSISLSLNQSQLLTPFLLRVSLDPAGAGPQHAPEHILCCEPPGWFTIWFYQPLFDFLNLLYLFIT